MLYRHFVKTGDGAICELEEGIPFTVDEHPLLESWPQARRRFLGSSGEPSSFGIDEDERRKLSIFLRSSECGGEVIPGPEEKDDEPQIVLIKNE